MPRASARLRDTIPGIPRAVEMHDAEEARENAEASDQNFEELTELASEHITLVAGFGYAILCAAGLSYAKPFYSQMGFDISSIAGLSDYAVIGFGISTVPVLTSLSAVALLMATRLSWFRSLVPRNRFFAAAYAGATQPMMALLLAFGLSVLFSWGAGTAAGAARARAPVQSYVLLHDQSKPLKLEFVGLIGGRALLRCEASGATQEKQPDEGEQESCEGDGRIVSASAAAVLCSGPTRAAALSCNSTSGDTEQNPFIPLAGRLAAAIGQPTAEGGGIPIAGIDPPQRLEVIDAVGVRQIAEALVDAVGRGDVDVDIWNETSIDGSVVRRSPWGRDWARQDRWALVQYARRELGCAVSAEQIQVVKFENDQPRVVELYEPENDGRRILEPEGFCAAAGASKPRLWVLGFASWVGDADYNERLSERRVSWVKREIERTWCGGNLDVYTLAKGEQWALGLQPATLRAKDRDGLEEEARRAVVLPCRPESAGQVAEDRSGMTRDVAAPGPDAGAP